MKDQLNKRVKFREWYRPFAPIVLEEEASKWFNMDFPSPYMLHTVPCKQPFKILLLFILIIQLGFKL